MTTTLTKPTFEVRKIDESTPWETRIEQRIENIEILCGAPEKVFLMLGAELAACKWSGEYIIDPMWRKILMAVVGQLG